MRPWGLGLGCWRAARFTRVGAQVVLCRRRTGGGQGAGRSLRRGSTDAALAGRRFATCCGAASPQRHSASRAASRRRRACLCDGEGDRVRVRAGVGARVRVGLGSSRDAGGRAACREVRAAIVQLLKQEGGVAAPSKAPPHRLWPAATWVAVAVTVTVTVGGGSSVHAAVWAGRLPSPLRLSSRNAESEAAAYGLSGAYSMSARAWARVHVE